MSPNIEGSAYPFLMNPSYTFVGAFKYDSHYAENLAGGADDVIQCGVSFNFLASYSNSLYGKSSVVQPNANRVFFIIKY